MKVQIVVKLLGAIFVILCGWGCGQAALQKHRLRRKTLQAAAQLLHQIGNEISYRKLPLKRIYEKLQECAAAKLLLFTPNGSFQTAVPPPVLSKEEQACFIECFSGMGQSGALQDCSRLEYYRQWFETAAEAVSQEENKAAALYGKLGAGVGLMAALAFL